MRDPLPRLVKPHVQKKCLRDAVCLDCKRMHEALDKGSVGYGACPLVPQHPSRLAYLSVMLHGPGEAANAFDGLSEMLSCMLPMSSKHTPSCIVSACSVPCRPDESDHGARGEMRAHGNSKSVVGARKLPLNIVRLKVVRPRWMLKTHKG